MFAKVTKLHLQLQAVNGILFLLKSDFVSHKSFFNSVERPKEPCVEKLSTWRQEYHNFFLFSLVPKNWDMLLGWLLKIINRNLQEVTVVHVGSVSIPYCLLCFCRKWIVIHLCLDDGIMMFLSWECSHKYSSHKYCFYVFIDNRPAMLKP